MLNLGEEALERARAELRAVQAAALSLAIVMARFGQDAEQIALLLRELDLTDSPSVGGHGAAQPSASPA